MTYHGKDLYELYNLRDDPWEHRDLSADPNHAQTLMGLLRASFDRQVCAIPPAPERIAPF